MKQLPVGSLVGRTLTDDSKFNGLNPVATGTKRKEIEGVIASCGSIFCRTIDSWFKIQGFEYHRYWHKEKRDR
jgi:hypothetical protein